MKRLYHWLAAATLFAAAGTLSAAPSDGLAVRLSVPAPVVRGDVDVVVTVTVTNTTRAPITVLRWELPSARHDNATFSILRDGQPVAYTGALVKRGTPTADDYVRIAPGATLTYAVELTAAYDLSRNGTYTIEYASKGSRDGSSEPLRSDALYLWLESRSGRGAVSIAPPVAATTPGADVVPPTYVGCSASQQSDLVTATNNALTYANGGLTYMAGARSATQRFTRWFGPGTRASWNTIRNNYTKIADAFATQQIVYDCSTCPAGPNASAYAYVYANAPYKIYLCNAFWAAPALGTDSKAGTLIHEMSHFTVVAGTSDFAYGQSAAANLAITNPANAIRNADSHEYFGENTPALP